MNQLAIIFCGVMVVGLARADWQACEECKRSADRWPWHGKYIDQSICKAESLYSEWKMLKTSSKSRDGMHFYPSKSCDACKNCTQCDSCFVSSTSFDPARSDGHVNTGGSKFKIQMIHDKQSVKYLVKLGVEKGGPTAPFVEPLQLLGLETGCSEVLPAEKVSDVYLLSDGGNLLSGKNAILTEYFKGIQAAQLSHQATWLSSNNSAEIAHLTSTSDAVRNAVVSFLQVNASSLILAAICDYIFANGDHGVSNILLVDNQIKLIDNQRILGSQVNSVFLPGTFHWYASQQNLGCLLDYRCHANGSIGMELPSKIHNFMKKISEMTVDDVYNQYHLPSTRSAGLLFERVRELQHGFENAWMAHRSKYRPEYIYGKEKFKKAKKKGFRVENLCCKHL